MGFEVPHAGGHEIDTSRRAKATRRLLIASRNTCGFPQVQSMQAGFMPSNEERKMLTLLVSLGAAVTLVWLTLTSGILGHVFDPG